MVQSPKNSLEEFLAFFISLLLDGQLICTHLKIKILSQFRAEVELRNHFILWQDLEEGGFEADGLGRIKILSYAGEVRKYGDIYFDKVTEITLPEPLDRFYDPDFYCVYITFLKLHTE
tara:strand:- start:519 stop:872 length:354 start_codon:yes stop_codon:yes gene_type:complete